MRQLFPSMLRWHAPGIAILLLPVIMLPASFVELDWRRALSGWFFVATMLLLTACLARIWPHHRKPIAAGGAAVVMAWWLGFMTNLYISGRYGAQLHSNLLIEALANSTPAERGDYVRHAMLPMSFSATLVMALMGATWWVVDNVTRCYAGVAAADAANESAWGRRLPAVYLAVLTLFAIVIHAHPSLRRDNPIAFWGTAAAKYRTWVASLDGLDERRRQALASVADWQPRLARDVGRNTVVLVLGESVNRWNWQLYGYPRATTPRLSALRSELLVFSDVIASAFSTVPNIERMLSGGTVDAPQEVWQGPTVPMLAKAAGYKVFWLTNQADRYLARMYVADADVRVAFNSGGGRGDAALDGPLVGALDEALKDPAPLKFIVVHMLGAHPHYDRRSEPRHKVFADVDDEVQREMRASRYFFVRWARNDYDAAMLYQDEILSGFIKSLKARAAPGQHHRLLFVSDHGQEVGHFRNTFGHSKSLESGYVVPLVVWPAREDGGHRRVLEDRPYQTDKLDWTVLSMLRITTSMDRPELDLLGAAFKPFPRYLNRRLYVPGHRGQRDVPSVPEAGSGTAAAPAVRPATPPRI